MLAYSFFFEGKLIVFLLLLIVCMPLEARRARESTGKLAGFPQQK
jgi:predicted ABC-type exoprotein transport system permease subunit